jgi:hypothetical protein
MKFAFIILSHSNPEQLLRLTRTLTAVYGDPVIVCHHDFSKSPLDISLFGPNVQFVQPHIETHYGKISIIYAAMEGFRLAMHGESPPDWFYLLSGADYPIRRREDVEKDLGEAGVDAFMDFRKIDFATLEQSKQPNQANPAHGFDRSSYIKLAYDRYLAIRLPIPNLKHPLRPPAAALLHIRWPALADRFNIFSEGYSCYAGEHWFTANRRAVELLLKEDSQHKRLLDHLARRPFVDECAYQTILCNEKSLKIAPRNLRYIQWEAGDVGRPNWLSLADLPGITGGSEHFARKIEPGSSLLDALDAHLGTRTAL